MTTYSKISQFKTKNCVLQVDVSLEIQKYVLNYCFYMIWGQEMKTPYHLRKAGFSIVASDISDYFFSLQTYLLKSIPSCRFHSTLVYMRCQKNVHLSIFGENLNKHSHVLIFTFWMSPIHFSMSIHLKFHFFKEPDKENVQWPWNWIDSTKTFC